MVIAKGRKWLGALCVAVCMGIVAGPVQAAPSDPLFTYSPTPLSSVPPGSGFNGPCGLAVDISGNIYLSDYYHRTVDVFMPGTTTLTYRTQISGIDPLDGPCGLAVDNGGRIYVNDFHRSVLRYTAAPFPPGPGAVFSGPVTIDSDTPTGVAVNSSTSTVYVNERDRVAAYSTAGALLEEIGTGGNIDDGYGLAVSQFPGTSGRLYVADASTKTVEVYDPLVNPIAPERTITGPPSGFKSLVDSAIAVDRVTGEIYVADRQSSVSTERPESTIQVFEASGAYRGHLKYNVVDGAPVGLAVDNSTGVNQGRVYVTSGNTTEAKVYVYPPGAATIATSLPPLSSSGSSGESGGGKLATQASAGAGEAPAVPATASEVAQDANVRLEVNGDLAPQKLPRQGSAPISASVGWKIGTTDGAPPPKLKTLKIEINRAGHFDLTGLPTCPYDKIQPATTSRALANCRSALVGRGNFSALIALAGQESYFARGQMLLFNGLQGKKPVLFGQIYSPRPFANSFVITFALSTSGKGHYRSSLTATLPPSLRAWGSLTEVQMRLQHTFHYKGVKRSFLSAGCPAPKGFTKVVFPLARTSFAFVGGLSQSLTLNRSCKARG
jgi:DNA-binding beta-propeller fold protein YncE